MPTDDDLNEANEPRWDFLARVPVSRVAIRYAPSGDAQVRITVPREATAALLAVTRHAGVFLRATFEAPAKSYIPPKVSDDEANEWGVDGAEVTDPPPRPTPIPHEGPMRPEDVLPHLLGNIVREADWTLQYGDTGTRQALIKSVLALAARAQTQEVDERFEKAQAELTEMRKLLAEQMVARAMPSLPPVLDADVIEDQP